MHRAIKIYYCGNFFTCHLVAIVADFSHEYSNFSDVDIPVHGKFFNSACTDGI